MNCEVVGEEVYVSLFLFTCSMDVLLKTVLYLYQGPFENVTEDECSLII